MTSNIYPQLPPKKSLLQQKYKTLLITNNILQTGTVECSQSTFPWQCSCNVLLSEPLDQKNPMSNCPKTGRHDERAWELHLHTVVNIGMLPIFYRVWRCLCMLYSVNCFNNCLFGGNREHYQENCEETWWDYVEARFVFCCNWLRGAGGDVGNNNR